MAKKIRTAEPQQKFTGSYKKKRVYADGRPFLIASEIFKWIKI